MPRHEAPQPEVYLGIKGIPPPGICLLGHEAYTSTWNVFTWDWSVYPLQEFTCTWSTYPHLEYIYLGMKRTPPSRIYMDMKCIPPPGIYKAYTPHQEYIYPGMKPIYPCQEYNYLGMKPISPQGIYLPGHEAYIPC